MKKLYTFCLLLFFANTFLHAQIKKVCVTIDDLPTVVYHVASEEYKLELTKDIVKMLKKNRIPAIGFVNEVKLYENGNVSQEEVNLLETWLKDGLELGNHTYSHLSYHNTSFVAFTDNIIEGEKVDKELAKRYSAEYKYFRHPFLNIGKTKDAADSLTQFLKEHHYIASPVTIDNQDYLFAQKYEQALLKEDKDEMEKVANAYLEHTKKKIDYYEMLSEKTFKRQIAQTLLIHANKLNADYLADIIKIFEKRDYLFISQTEVLKDKAYSEPITKYGPWGISWLERWVMSKGTNKDLLKLNPEVPAFIAE
ncbi:polysaccharide deacetylase family protein [Chondrinema litorale]|uniref:polysaccharide deacetylase family protein n=1 Tax=Chondrinema litorale TaxID=2994555 RepID=UPI002542CBD5|nr:polysaccharide deacetylase family protein [Chondrinema litorale]UZR96639.1 polysaccharide deacetylase family protein [Chondrinema litorale]